MKTLTHEQLIEKIAEYLKTVSGMEMVSIVDAIMGDSIKITYDGDSLYTVKQNESCYLCGSDIDKEGYCTNKECEYSDRLTD